MNKQSKMSVALIALLPLLALSRPAQAFQEIGAGVSSCEEWTADLKHPENAEVLQDDQWLLGFLSGVGYAGTNEDPLNGIHGDAVISWMNNYCYANPFVSIGFAATAFIKVHPK